MLGGFRSCCAPDAHTLVPKRTGMPIEVSQPLTIFILDLCSIRLISSPLLSDRFFISSNIILDGKLRALKKLRPNLDSNGFIF